MHLILVMLAVGNASASHVPTGDVMMSQAPSRALAYQPSSATATRRWQVQCRKKLFELMMGGRQPARIPLAPQVIRKVEVPGAPYVLEEVTIQSLPDRRAHLWVAAPRHTKRKHPLVLAIHGHGGTGEQIVRGESLYWYGKALAEMGYIVIAPDVGSHELQHRDWSLMGERVWDCMRALDYAETRHDVDPNRMAVCGLSLGGETTMYVAALDTRLKAVCSSGWLTTVANMRNGHCTCYDFPGLAENFDFADIFGCIAPRPLVCEIGEKERAPGGFPVSVARPAFAEIQRVYAAFGKANNATLTIHPGGHVFVGYDFWPILARTLGNQPPYRPGRDSWDECRRRGVLYERAMARATSVLRGWWVLRDPQFGMLPRTVTERVWAPNDNAADLLPFLYLTEYYTEQGYAHGLRKMLSDEARLTNRLGVLPDWFSLETGTWVHATTDVNRMIFCAAEYCKDGLMPMTEAMGRGPWTERMRELMDAILQAAPVETAYGRIPAADTEVNGDVLQVLGRLYAMTREQRYLDMLLTIADAYCFEVIPATGGIPAYRWDFGKHTAVADAFSLNDHGNEIVLGLVEAYISAKSFAPERAERYRPPLLRMVGQLLSKARNNDGMWVGEVRATTGQVLQPATPDTWGYTLCGVLALARAADSPELRDEVVRAVESLRKPVYANWSGADSYADSVEGAILLQNRLGMSVVDSWLDTVLPILFAHQKDSGIVEGWYGDGNFARTALMVALYESQGVRCVPWQSGLRCGAVRTARGVLLSIQSDAPWNGRVIFDTPRHREVLGLAWDYPRLNQWPEWFVVERGKRYAVRKNGAATVLAAGSELAEGLPLRLQAGQAVTIAIDEPSDMP